MRDDRDIEKENLRKSLEIAYERGKEYLGPQLQVRQIQYNYITYINIRIYIDINFDIIIHLYQY